MLSIIIRQHIEKKFGRPVRYHSDCESLSFDIEKETRQKVSVNTIKRLFGIIDGSGSPRLYTLDVLALYLGFANWDVFLMSMEQTGNSGFNSLQEVLVETLPENSVVEFRYEPDRIVKVQLTKEKLFRVLECNNSKLQVNDILHITHFVLGYPLVALHVIRNGIDLGRFTAGRSGGLNFLKIVNL